MSSSDDGTPRLAHDLRIACMRIARRVRFDAEGEVVPHLFSILARLIEQPRTVGELASIEKVSAPSMSRSVGQLTELGYAQRSADEHDGRLVRISITPAGAEVVHHERKRRDAWMTEKLESLDPQDRELLRQAADLMERMMAG